MKPFLREVAEDLIAKFGNELQHTAIVFNNKRPVAYLQNHMADVIQKPFWSPSFYTIQEFFALSTKLRIADPFTQFFTLFKNYNQLITREGGNAIELSKFYPVARIILSDFTQIDNDLVNAEKLFKELEDIAEIDFQFDYLTEEQQEFLKGFWQSYSEGKQKKQQEQFIRMWRRMPQLYKNFHQDLRTQGLTTMGNAYRELAEKNAGQADFLNQFKRIIFVGFNALSAAETTLFKQWQEQQKALFYFDTDSYYIDDKTQEAGLFLRKNLERTGLINALGENPSLIRSNSKTVTVYQAQGQTAQAKILHQALQSDYPLLSETNNAGKIALIMADESLLLPVLQTIPTHYTDRSGKKLPVKLNVTMGYPLALSSIFGLADLWLCAQTQMGESKKSTVNFKEVEAFLSQPLTGTSEKMRSKIRQALIDEQLVEVPAERLKSQKGLFSIFFEKITDAAKVTNALQEVLRFVLDRQLEQKSLKQTEADLFVAVIKELNKLHDALVTHLQADKDQKVNRRELSFVLSLIQKALQGIAVPLTGEPLEGIQVMGLLESRNLDFEKVYLLGFNEGVLPQTSVSNSFIPDGIRRAHGLPVLENQDAIFAYMFYRLLQRSKEVSLVYNSQPDDTNTGEPSRFLRQLEYESGYNFRYLQHQQTVSTERRIAVQVEKDKQIMSVLNKYLTGEMRLSATALTTYINCPLQFFYKYIARIEEPEEVAENVEANIIGLMLHLVMENFYSALKKTDPLITKERISESRKDLFILCEKAYAKIVFDDELHPVAHNGMQKVVLAIVAEYANIILDHDEEHAPFEIIALEKKDEIEFRFEMNEAQKTLTLHGIIDRIDRKNGTTRIVDYKTGSDDLKFSSIDDAFDTHGSKQNKALVQTLFYTHVFEQANAQEWVELNLYVVRKLRSENAFFKEGYGGKTLLSGERLQTIKHEFLVLMTNKLKELFDENIPFTPTTNEAGFIYSPYITLCGMG